MDSSIFRAYDIRGIYPTELNETNIVTVTNAIYQFFTEKLGKKNLTIALGRDMRLSSPSLNEVVRKTLLNLGITVVDIGLSSTPTVYFSVYHFKYDAGIQISASHNPKQWNGIKFFYRVDNKLIKVSKNTGMDEVKNLALKNEFTFPESEGKLINKEVVKEEVDYAFQLVNPKINKFKVIADTANAMGALYLEEIFKRTNCELIKMNFELDGNMPVHEANPIKFETLKDLQERIKKEKANFGIATDGDGDRIFFIDEKSQIIPSTLISALIAREILTRNKNEKILVDIRYTRNTVKVVKDFGGTPIINMVGHALITETLNKENGAFSGESSGHYFFRETGGAESSVRVIYYLMDVLSKYNKPLSEIITELLSSYESGEFNFKLPENENNQNFLKKISESFKDGTIDWMDGISVDYPDWRFNIRGSNNEPLIRLNLEADKEELMKEKLAKVKEKIISLGAVSD
ncbi:phosphomannomutase/phosphoglucomutase [Candidatus Roizmanbacteria bacterium]|nr:phosphomannomutase/phosphoglucomutase [Candidatus Roizmanbacteria bacterium]